MRLSAYQYGAGRTLPRDEAGDINVRHTLGIMGLGLAGESGEVIEHLKKHLGHGRALNLDLVSKELGDVLWYLAAIATLTGIDLDVVARENLEKLQARYPNGFQPESMP